MRASSKVEQMDESLLAMYPLFRVFWQFAFVEFRSSIYTLVSSLDIFWTLFIMLWLVLAQKLGLSGRCRQLANKLKYNLTFFKAALTKYVIVWIEKSYWIPSSKDIPLLAWLCMNTKISAQNSFPPTALSSTVNLHIEERYEEIWLNDFVIGIHI